MTNIKDRLRHAMHAWADIRSAAHADALNALIESTCAELCTLRQLSEQQADALRSAHEFIAILRRELSHTAEPAVVDAPADLCTAYRTISGLDGAWDQVVIRAEQVVSASRTAQQAQKEPAA